MKLRAKKPLSGNPEGGFCFYGDSCVACATPFVGFNLYIVIPHEQSANPYMDADKLINFDFFFVRKVIFVKYAQGFVVLPAASARSMSYSSH